MDAFRKRFIFIIFFLVLLFVLLIGRLFQIQIINGWKYSKRSDDQSKDRTIVKAKRGNIRDCSGEILSRSITSQLEVHDEMLTYSPKKRNTGKKNKYNHNSGIKRIYPYGELASTVLGYVGKDGYGLAGVEFYFDKYLRGEDGWNIIQKDGRNKRYPRIGMPKKVPKSGHDVYLTINIQIQRIVENILDQTVKHFKAKGGMCIIMDPINGDILTMTSKPDFNPNAWHLYDASYRTNRCISYNLEPGSTFKVITAAAILQENILQENDSIDGNKGVYNIYNQVIRDHTKHENITFAEALYYSSNVCFAQMADKLGNKRFYKYIKDFGFGALSDICLPGEEDGIVHPISRWSGRTRVTMAIGQEISTTLLRMLIVYSAIANGGVIIKPRIYTKIVDSEGSVIQYQKPRMKRRVLSEDVASRLRVMLRGVVENGTAKKSASPGLSIGGKTGTSQKIDTDKKRYSRKRVWTSFIGFLPVQNPVFVCGILIDEPTHGNYGGTVACPAFKEIVQRIVSHPNLEYTKKLIDKRVLDSLGQVMVNQRLKEIPDMRGMDREQAGLFLSSEGIPYEIIGTGQTIAYQNPSVRSNYVTDTKLLLFSDDIIERDGRNKNEIVTVQVPDCRGKDLKDAINTLNLKGLVPYIYGSGIVRNQNPSYGTKISKIVPCTLICSFDEG